MIQRRIEDDYFEWLLDLMCKDKYADDISYRKLFVYLHQTEFRWIIPKDKNRADDGIALRYRFSITQEYPEDVSEYIEGPCSVLEMMVALAIRCEETIMDDPRYGDRTKQWFWGMITSLGLNAMEDRRFDKKHVHDIIERFLDRDYQPNGKGGLFTIKNCNRDLRDVEIWYQLNWYLNSIIG